MLVVSAFVSGIATDVPAKTEGGGTPAGAKEIPPYIEGTLILLADGTASFVGECVTAFDTRFFNVQFNLDIQVAVASGGSNPNNSVEGTIVRSLSVPAGCFKDGATSVDVVIKSVKNFTPDAPPGSRTSIVARIAVARFV
jgi:hypothetical protein